MSWTTGQKVGAGFGLIAAISIIYFVFTDKGKAKWADLTGPKGTDPLAGKPNINANDAVNAVKNGADGTTAIPRKPGFGSPFGSNGADGSTTKRTFGKGGEFAGVTTFKRKEGDTSNNPKYQCPAGMTLTKNTDGTYTCRSKASAE